MTSRPALTGSKRIKCVSLRLLSILATFLCAQYAQACAAGESSTALYDVQLDSNRRVMMRDNVELSADIYHPAAAGRFPVILVRTPYNKSSDFKNRLFLTQGRYFAARGYVYVAMDVRGRG
jgi:predicted acyl esterase